MGFFSINKEVFPIGICLRGPIRGTRLDGKLNLLLLLIRSLLNRKALGPNSIPNKILKVVALVIAKDLAEIASNYFTNKTILKSLKEFITVVLRKKGKKNYSLLDSYRLIAFKNMLAKVLEKYIANIILKAAEEYRLLF